MVVYSAGKIVFSGQRRVLKYLKANREAKLCVRTCFSIYCCVEQDKGFMHLRCVIPDLPLYHLNSGWNTFI